MIKKILLLAVIIWIAVNIVGCQTVQGVGRDIEWLGQATAIE